MSLLLYLYLIHFVADYTFQWSALVKYKADHFLGILIHSTIHLVVHLVVLAPFLHEKKVWIAIAVIYLAHIGLDQSKMELNKADPKHIRLFYFVDQAIHLTVITICGLLVGHVEPAYLSGWALTLFTDQSVVLYLLFLTLSTYFFDVTCHFINLKKFNEEYRRNYRAMLINAGIVTAVFGVYWAAGL